jgi:hypothetical protein
VRYLQKNLYILSSGLTAPGSGNAYTIDLPNRSAPTNYSVITVVTAINTNVVVRLDGSIDGINFAPVITGQTITGNGAHFYTLQNTPLKAIQPVFVSESGGTDAVVQFQIAAAI